MGELLALYLSRYCYKAEKGRIHIYENGRLVATIYDGRLVNLARIYMRECK